MTSSFTEYISASIWQFNTDDTLNAIAYFNNPDTFRPFSAGLTELMIRSGYKGAVDDIKSKSDYIYNKLNAINISIARQTIIDWFKDKRRPSFNSESRIKMFQLCFALSASFDNVKWFFNHVYFSRSFNCHTIEESVYYYCFLNHLPYEHAESLIREIRSYPDNTNSSTPAPNFSTQEVTKKLSEYTTDKELLHFFRNNKHIFSSWNKTALSYIDKFFNDIIGSEESKEVIKNIKNDCRRIERSSSSSPNSIFRNSSYLNDETIRQCGLLIREIYAMALRDEYAESLYDEESIVLMAHQILEDIDKQDTFSRSFVLEHILTAAPELPKDVPMPDVAKKNFPSKKILSDLLDPKKGSIYLSYDSIRKCLLLLHFYCFWCNNTLDSKGYEYDDFVEETNVLLDECGYEELYAGNPYDWLLLWASATDEPLDSLRLIASGINPPNQIP